MKSPLFAVAVTALAGGLLLAPAVKESAQAQAYGALGGAGTKTAGNVILVGKGGGFGGGGRGGGFRGGGFKSGGGLGGGGLRAGGSYRGGLGPSGRSFRGAYRGGGSFKAYGASRPSLRAGGPRASARGLRPRSLKTAKHWQGGNWHGGKWKGKHGHKHRRFHAGYWWYAPVGLYGYNYGYGDCEWLRDRALLSGSSYWWRRYNDCIGYY